MKDDRKSNTEIRKADFNNERCLPNLKLLRNRLVLLEINVRVIQIYVRSFMLYIRLVQK